MVRKKALGAAVAAAMAVLCLSGCGATGGGSGTVIYANYKDGDGFTEAQVEGGGNVRIRATAVVWAAGPDGKVDYGSMAKNDDVYSWSPAQVKK